MTRVWANVIVDYTHDVEVDALQTLVYTSEQRTQRAREESRSLISKQDRFT